MQATTRALTSGSEAAAPRWPLFLVCLCAILVYANSFPGSFFMDDVQIVAQNPLVRHPDLLQIFTSDYWGRSINSGLYRPLTILSFAVNRWLLGPEPWSFHLVNLLLHATICGLLLDVFRKLGCSDRLACVGALFFAVHPLHTEVVNTAVGRSELLVALLLLLALKLALRDETPPRNWGIAACYATALLSKEHAIAFLLLLPAVDTFRTAPAGTWHRRLPLYLLLAGVTLGWLVLRLWGVDHGDIPRDPYDPIYAPLAFLPSLARIVSAFWLQFVYLGKLLLPLQQQGVYAGSGFESAAAVLTPATVVLVLLGVAGYGTAIWYGLRRRHLFGLALLCYALTALPTANLFFATGVSFAERLAYFPSVWFCLGFILAAKALFARLPLRAAMVLALVGLLAYAAATVRRNHDYRSPLALWSADIRSDPLDPQAWLLLGTELENSGDAAAAEEAYREAVRLAPRFADAHNSYGRLLYRQGRFEAALQEARQATATGQGVFGAAYVLLARTCLQLGYWDEALAATERLPEFQRRRYGLFWELRGLALAGKGDAAGALAAFARELEVEPGRLSDVFRRIGLVRLRLADPTQAESAFRQDLTRGESVEAWNGLGLALAQQGRQDEAEQAFGRASALDARAAEQRRELEEQVRGRGR